MTDIGSSEETKTKMNHLALKNRAVSSLFHFGVLILKKYVSMAGEGGLPVIGIQTHQKRTLYALTPNCPLVTGRCHCIFEC